MREDSHIVANVETIIVNEDGGVQFRKQPNVGGRYNEMVSLFTSDGNNISLC